MSDNRRDPYSKNRAAREMQRVVCELPPDLVRDADGWGLSTGKTSRRETIEALIRAGLKSEGVEAA